MTPLASGLPPTLPVQARAALAARAEPTTGRFLGASSIAALLFLLDRARDGDEEAARLALSVLGRTPSNVMASACAAAAEAAVHVEAVDVRRDGGLEKTTRAAVDAALAAFGWSGDREGVDDRERSAIHSRAASSMDAGTDAHGLMIATLARASVVFDAPGYREAASWAGEHALDRRVDARWGTLLHLCGDVRRPAGLGDYALLVLGLLELLSATGEKGWLHEAVRLQGEQQERLWDVREGGYFESPEGTGRVAKKYGSDGSFVSGNGIAALNLIDLSRLTGQRSYRARAEQVLRAFAPEIASEPLAHLTLLRAAQRLERTASAA